MMTDSEGIIPDEAEFLLATGDAAVARRARLRRVGPGGQADREPLGTAGQGECGVIAQLERGPGVEYGPGLRFPQRAATRSRRSSPSAPAPTHLNGGKE